MSKKIKDTSLDFDDCIGFTDTQYKKNDLSEFLGLDLVPETAQDAEKELHNHLGWRDHWKGMPEYESEIKSNFKQVLVSFKTEEDYKAFQKVIGQELTPKTKSIFFPKKENAQMSLLRWLDAEDDGLSATDDMENVDADE